MFVNEGTYFLEDVEDGDADGADGFDDWLSEVAESGRQAERSC